MKAIANAIRLSYNDQDRPEVTLTLVCGKSDAKTNVSELKEAIENGKPLAVEIKQHRKKRSLDSNSYAWLLITAIANALHTSKEELYIEMLKRYGQREPQLLSVIADAVDMVYRATDNHCYVVGDSELNGKRFKHLAILIGSSQYDSKQMSMLIDGIVSEAKELGIETMTPQELEAMNNAWAQKHP